MQCHCPAVCRCFFLRDMCFSFVSLLAIATGAITALVLFHLFLSMCISGGMLGYGHVFFLLGAGCGNCHCEIVFILCHLLHVLLVLKIASPRFIMYNEVSAIGQT